MSLAPSRMDDRDEGAHLAQVHMLKRYARGEKHKHSDYPEAPLFRAAGREALQQAPVKFIISRACGLNALTCLRFSAALGSMAALRKHGGSTRGGTTMHHDRTEPKPEARPMSPDEARRERRRLRERVVIDRRTRAARRLAELEAAFLADLQAPSEADRALAKQAAALTVESERLAARIARSEPVDHEQAVRLANAATRALNALNKRSAGRTKRKGPMTARELMAARQNGGGA
ncbi:hypothetical protein ACTZWW_03100 [Salinarimonas sp. NSM]|uniref:hypothetical protein n=1 Tax=Salinarimonas sp. NSM TaxID=3458003 RepID=UPI004036E0B5